MSRLTREAEQAIEQLVGELEDLLKAHREATEQVVVSGPERIEPVYIDENGTARFRPNLVVRHLLDHGGLNMNDLVVIGFPPEERQHFDQLIGYSVSGYSSLSYVSTSSIERARELVAALQPSEET